MGIVFVSVTASDEMIQRVLDEPPLIWRLYSPEDKDFYISAIGADKKPNLIARLLGAKEVPVPEPLPSFLYKDGERREIDLDKSWDGINFCLKKLLAEDCPNLFEDGREIGSVEVGYGPAMSFFSSEIKKIFHAYDKISSKMLLDAFAPNEMGNVYPKAVWSEDDKETREYLEENFVGLVDYLRYAVDNRLGAIIVYT
ncbi:MAG: DUF1877 family protein [Psychromonas sp.]